ncbi:MFS transporter [Methanospirillum sp.]|uniref:MFS transporter n=3 Tax=Methanospirillum sp. TaxID=45200 RepID=UPI002C4611D6|nr:MFS transporter [Methanospirillum sp.]HOL40890.1 MFS transporter [Methanospirillum sp.]HPP77363.1 MFS transporter [Methanospirillum sp.]
MHPCNTVQITDADRRFLFISLYVAVFSTMLGIGIVIPLLPRFAETLGASGFGIGIIFSSFAVSRALAMPFFGRYSDVCGRRQIMTTGLFLYTVFSLLYIPAGSVLALSGVRFLQGIASAMVFPIAMAYIGDIAPPGMEGRYLGTFTSSLFLGMGLGPFLGGIITDLAGMDMAFVCMALLTGLALLTCLLYLPWYPGRRREQTPVFHLLIHPGLRIPILYQLMNAFANGTFMVFLPVIAAHIGNLSVGETGLVISVSVLSSAFLQKICGSLADRFDKYLLIAGGSMILAIALILVPGFHGLWAYLLFALLMGIGGGISVPAMYALVTITGREVGQGAAMGTINMFMSIGMILSPLVCGVCMDQMGISSAFSISAIIVLLATPVFISKSSLFLHSSGNT